MSTLQAGRTGDERSATRRAFANRTFAASYVAEAQSIFGDQLARIALAILVYRLTGSTPATAATYAATFLPAIAGGVLLGRIGDRVSRRSVMVGCDVVRACCFAIVAVRPHPVALVIVLVVVSVTLGPAFSAAQMGLLASRLDLDEFTAGNAVRLVTSQAAQVAGFAVGGVIVVALGPAGALAVNALTFAASAVVLQLVIPASSPTAHATKEGDGGKPQDPAVGAQAETSTETVIESATPAFTGLWRDRAARPLVVLSLCIGFFVVPEGLAIPFADSMGVGSRQAGFLLASGALGGALGAAALTRVNSAVRTRWSNVMAVLCGVPLLLSALLAAATTQWWLVAVCWLLSGALAAYVIQPTSVLVHAIPDVLRSRSVGVLSALLLGSQGLAVLAFGGIAAGTSPAVAVGLAGAIGCVLTAMATVVPSRGGGGWLRHRVATG